MQFSSAAIASENESSKLPALKNSCNIIFSYHVLSGEKLDIDDYAKVTSNLMKCGAQPYFFEKDVFKKRELKKDLDEFINNTLELTQTYSTYAYDAPIAVEHYNFDTKEFNVRINASKKRQDTTIFKQNIGKAYLFKIITPKLDLTYSPTDEEEARKIESIAGSEFSRALKKYNKTIPARFYLKLVDASRQRIRLSGKMRDVKVLTAEVIKIEAYHMVRLLKNHPKQPKLLFTLYPKNN
jgi:hypothetical protein